VTSTKWLFVNFNFKDQKFFQGGWTGCFLGFLFLEFLVSMQFRDKVDTVLERGEEQ